MNTGNKGLVTAPYFVYLFNHPIADIPEDAYAMMSQHRIRCNAGKRCVRAVNGIQIAEESIRRIFRKRDLEILVIFSPFFRILCLAGLDQVLVHQFVGVARVVGALIRAKHLVGVIIRVKRRSPADDTARLPAPVDPLCGHRRRHIQTDSPQLLRRTGCPRYGIPLHGTFP